MLASTPDLICVSKTACASPQKGASIYKDYSRVVKVEAYCSYEERTPSTTAARGTGHDIGLLSCFSAAPTDAHWEAAKHTLCYLQATKDMELVYDGSDVTMDMDFHGYSDADWSGDPDTSRSTSGYIFISNQAAISWASKCQSMVALSSTESEYIGLSIARQHIQWLRTFFDEIGQSQSGLTELNCDNQAAIILCKDPQFWARTKHIQRKYHHIQDDLVAKGEAVIHYVPTND